MLNKQNSPPQLQVRCVTSYDDYVPDFYRTFRCGTANVCDALADDVPYWTLRNPTLIEAPPGKGKTTLVYKELIPLARKSNKNVLLISNRVALSSQQKIMIMKVLQSPMLGCLTDKGIREAENYGSVCVITYHRLPAFVNDPQNQHWIKNLMYVVAGEVHFFVADSFFNERCGYYGSAFLVVKREIYEVPLCDYFESLRYNTASEGFG